MSDVDVRRRAWRVVLAFGIVSLLADVVYEGARSVIGPYLGTLGASATVVGIAAGAGDFTGYVLRVPAGRIADRFGHRWTLTIAGYGLTVVAVPLLGLVGRVDLALALVVAERLGKAIRSPARDAILAEAAEPIGRGRAFGIHEAMDQTGAVAGPLLMALLLALRDGDYRLAFGALAIPGALVLASLWMARRSWPEPSRPSTGREAGTTPAPIDGRFRAYLGFSVVTAIGLLPFPLAAFHLVDRAVVSEAVVPLLFALAMGVDAVAALVAGYRFDRIGLRVVGLLPVLGVGAVAMLGASPLLAAAGVVAWGAALGLHESVLRAGVAEIVVPELRATAYGWFGAAYGTALLVGGTALGVAYEVGVPVAVALVVAAQAAAVVLFVRSGLGRRTEVVNDER